MPDLDPLAELPVDPDWDSVPSDLRILQGLNHGIVNTRYGPAALAVVPGLFAHARRLAETDDDE